MIISNKKTVKKQEKKIANIINGKRQPFSGAKVEAKGDAKSEHFLVEAKQTANQSISLKLKWVEKIDKEAMEADRYPLMDIEFLNAGKYTTKQWTLMPQYLFEEMFEAWIEKQKGDNV